MIAQRVSIFNQAWGPHLRQVVCALAEAGAKCTVYTGSDWKEKGTFPEGLVIKDSPTLNRTSVARRFLSWMAYSFAATRHLLRCDADERVLMFSNPPILPFFGWLCSLVRGYKYSVFVYDIYPEVMAGMGLGRANLVVRAWKRLNRVVYEHAFAVITIGDVMSMALAKQFDPARTSPGKIIVSRVWVDTQLFCPRAIADNEFAVPRGKHSRVTVLFAGNMGLTHDMETILGAARLMESAGEIEFLFVASGAGFLALKEASRALTNVRVLPRQPEEKMPSVWAAAEIALITLRPGIEQYSFPSKTAFALSAGCAIIGITEIPSDLADMIGRGNCGIVVKPGDIEGLVRALTAMGADRTLLDGYRARARETARELFEGDRNIAAMLQGIPAG